MSFSDALFKEALKREDLIYIKSYKNFARGFRFGFSDGAAEISVQQNLKDDVFVSPPDHSFTLDIDFGDVSGAKWITLEGTVDSESIVSKTQVTALVSMRSSTLSPCYLDLRIHKKDGSNQDMRIGTVTVNKDNEFNRTTISNSLSAISDILREDVEAATLLLFLPVESNQKISLSMFNVFFTRGGW